MNKPEFLLFCGGPGSGKSHIIDTFYRDSGHVLIDSDRIASFIYCAFEEDRNAVAKAVADDMISRCIDAAAPVLVHATGAAYEKCGAMLANARERGYKTILVWVKCPQEVAAARNGHRSRNIGTTAFEERWRLSVANIPRLCELADEVRRIENGAYSPGLRDAETDQKRVSGVHDEAPRVDQPGSAASVARDFKCRYLATALHGG